ncbi:MAG: DUF2628 domain-containing protein [Mogibacterium sp.]|nr:DUF2628 domain-containing protein [Mogibacterium sp.]
MADNYNNGPVWHRPGSGIENEPDSNWENEITGNLFRGFPGGINGNDAPPQDVDYETQPEQDPFQGQYGGQYDSGQANNSFSGRYGEQQDAPSGSQYNQSNQYSRYDQVPTYDTTRAAQAEAHELAYYFAKGKGSREPSERLVNMTATGRGFNFAAFFLGIFYLLYRKLYLEAGIAYAFAFVLTMFTDSGSNWYITLAVSVAFGLLFPFLYHNKMEKKVHDAIRVNADIRSYLTEKGGTNIILPVVLIIIYIVALFYLGAV